MIPLFKSHYSLGRSILTLEDKSEVDDYPDSIIQIAKENKLKEVFLVEDNMSSFLEAYTNTRNNDIKLNYGLRITITESIEDKSEESRSKNSKIIIFFKNNQGYSLLTRLYSKASKEGFYYEPRLDYKTLSENWTNDLLLCIPFYDSFIYNNTLRNFICVPNFSFTKPIVFIEDNDLPFDIIVKNKMLNFIKENNLEVFAVKSIYYKTKKDFKSYLTFRCINNRTTLNKPEIEHMSSDSFSFEEWKNYANTNK
jgi:DNA polymerase-3 subunit alpha